MNDVTQTGSEAVSRPVLLAAGTFDADAHPRIRVLIEGMRERGWEVDEITEPLAFPTQRRVEVLQHASRLPRLALALVRAWSGLLPKLRRRMRSGRRPDAVVVGHLAHFDVAPVRFLTRPAPVVLDYLISGAGTAADRHVGGGVKLRLLRWLDRFALKRADLIVVDTDEHLADLPPGDRARAIVVPVGADHRWSSAMRPLEERPAGPLRVVFFGLFTPLQGTVVVAEALRILDGAVAATIVGSGQDSGAVDALLAGVPGVRRLDWVAADELPPLVASHDVCLGIFGTGDKAQRVVPNKVYQGAAAGCGIVTSDTAPQRRALGDAALYVPVGDPVSLARALQSLATDAAQLATLQRASRMRASRDFAAGVVVEGLDVRLRQKVPARG